jgi:hypothetical protein
VTRSFGENTFESGQNMGQAKNAKISLIDALLKPDDTYNRQCFETAYNNNIVIESEVLPFLGFFQIFPKWPN